ncbi:MAG: nucleotide exchange factor GrpE [Angelakisella sp.]
MALKKDEIEQKKKTTEIALEEPTGETNAKAPPEAEPETMPEPSPEEKPEIKLKEAEDRNLRLMAEFDNFRRRTQKEKETIYPDAVANTLKELLPLLDNFERALTAPCTDEEYRKGVQMTYDGFTETLGRLGLAEFGAAGEAFDPAFHNAVAHIEDDKLGKNVISQVFQRGYKIGNNVLRYAMVQTAN